MGQKKDRVGCGRAVNCRKYDFYTHEIPRSSTKAEVNLTLFLCKYKEGTRP